MNDATVEVEALTHAQRLAARHDSGDDLQSGWSLDTSDPKLAILRMPTWALYDSKWDWKAFLDRTFAELDRRNPAALVIDLRGNEGGLDVGDAILPHLLSAPLALAEPPRLVRYRKVPDALAPMLDTWDQSFKDWGSDAVRYDDAFLSPCAMRTATTAPRRIEPKATALCRPRLRTRRSHQQLGDLPVRRTGAARTTWATLVGQTTGGNQRGINGGAFFFLRLPNTQIELDLPLIARFVEGVPDAGLTPGYRRRAQRGRHRTWA